MKRAAAKGDSDQLSTVEYIHQLVEDRIARSCYRLAIDQWLATGGLLADSVSLPRMFLYHRISNKNLQVHHTVARPEARRRR